MNWSRIRSAVWRISSNDPLSLRYACTSASSTVTSNPASWVDELVRGEHVPDVEDARGLVADVRPLPVGVVGHSLDLLLGDHLGRVPGDPLVGIHTPDCAVVGHMTSGCVRTDGEGVDGRGPPSAPPDYSSVSGSVRPARCSEMIRSRCSCFSSLSPAFGSSLPVVDGGRHGLLARNRQFVDLAHRDRVGREDPARCGRRAPGRPPRVPVADHCPRFRLRQSLCGPPSRSGSVPKVHHVAGDEAIRFICGLQRVERELLDDFHAREPP